MIKRILFAALLTIALACIMTSCKCKHEQTEMRVGREPTCSEAGYSIEVCAECGEPLVVGTEIPKIEHTYEKWTVITEPTCEEEGGKSSTCSVCNHYEYASIPALGGNHVWKKATCDSPKECTVCHKKEGSSLGHTYEGTTDGTCTRCGYGTKFILPTIPATVYNYSDKIYIESLTIERERYGDDYTYNFTFVVESLYNDNGNNYSESAYLGWKLYDEEGFVIKSGSASSEGQIKVGEKSKVTISVNVGESYSSSIAPNKTYKLVLLDIG